MGRGLLLVSRVNKVFAFCHSRDQTQGVWYACVLTLSCNSALTNGYLPRVPGQWWPLSIEG